MYGVTSRTDVMKYDDVDDAADAAASAPSIAAIRRLRSVSFAEHNKGSFTLKNIFRFSFFKNIFRLHTIFYFSKTKSF